MGERHLEGHFFPFAVSSWHKGGFHAGKGFVVCAETKPEMTTMLIMILLVSANIADWIAQLIAVE